MKRSFPTIRLLPADEQLAAEFNAALAAEYERVLARLEKAMQVPASDKRFEDMIRQAQNHFQKGRYNYCEQVLTALGF